MHALTHTSPAHMNMCTYVCTHTCMHTHIHTLTHTTNNALLQEHKRYLPYHTDDTKVEDIQINKSSV